MYTLEFQTYMESTAGESLRGGWMSLFLGGGGGLALILSLAACVRPGGRW